MASSDDEFDAEFKSRLLEIQEVSKKFNMDDDLINNLDRIEDKKVDQLIDYLKSSANN